MAKKKTVQKEEPIFVGIHNSLNLRKNVLECSKKLLTSVKDVESLKTVRGQKQKKIEDLKKLLTNIRTNLNRLKKRLPVHIAKEENHLDIDKNKNVSAVSNKENSSEKKSSTKKNAYKTELESIEEELERIEKKLVG
ncbi:MAG: hypothetical protein ACQER9_02810 [Nanobdellota archaeon]